jgi:hypothetical protein
MPDEPSCSAVALSKPTTYRDVVTYLEWQFAMAEEIVALERTDIWDLVPHLLSVVLIMCKWVYKIKTRSDGSIERFKEHLVARDFQHQYGRDYEDTFAPIAHWTTVHTLIAVTSVHRWTILLDYVV